MLGVDGIAPLPLLKSWTDTLTRIAAGPLEFCEDFPIVAKRFEAWWAQGLLDRPVFIASVNTNPGRPINRRLDLLEDPDEWFEATFADMRQIRWIGDAIPHIRADFGPVLLSSVFGGDREFGSDTGWTRAFINDEWSNAPDWRLAEHNHWWTLLRRLTQVVAEDARGRYLYCTPDLGASADVLLNLRGSAQLCTDVIMEPDRVRAACDAMFPAWQHIFAELYDIALKNDVGLIHWLGLWSNRPYHVPACDFNFMIGPEEFRSVCMPDIVRQSAGVGRAVFHLDGPGAARHIDALLEGDSIQAIQFTPGEGAPSALAWVEMFRKIQRRGRSVLVFCPPDEVLDLCDALKPEGLAILVSGPISPAKLDDLFETFCRRYQAKS